ncbi:MAG: hypothetical protein HOI23_02430 [Deltaproteobacteria bacterium]|jgi:hypothetical protein|nr:hypothetical protein [Deltaproteobacteria bacterium]MBT6431617.1 hypothetical protein [Deltaproteobacteria bacterium]MBT6488327.1 hypothetical protein [Deltaproteobacteria bacterium]
MKLTVSLDENLYKQAVEATEIADQAELLNQALEALLTQKGVTAVRTAALRAAEELAAANAQEVATQNATQKAPPTGPAAKFFGEYLVYLELITKDQLGQATNYVDSHNVRLGQLAVDQGFMTNTQADALNKKQREVDKPFGALSVEHGLLTEEQLNELLTIQKAKRIRIGDAIKTLELLTAQVLEDAFTKFEKLGEKPVEVKEHPLLPKELAGNRMAELVIETFPKIATRVAGIQSKVDHGRPVTPNFMWDCTASLILADEDTLKVYLSVNEDLADTILRRLFGDEMAESEMAPEFDDAIAEFLTIVTAAAVRSLSEEGQKVKMNRSEIESQAPATGYAFPLNSPDGNGSILLVPNA